ncbi:MAG: chemotaxis protein CheD [Candidatus Omnitrophota bacterium]
MNKDVRMGEIEVGKSGDDLIASGIGSCLVITLYDSKQKIGALAHTMLPARRVSFEVRDSNHELRKTNPGSPDTRYADIAIDEMIKRIEAQGAKKEFIEAKIIGGANMFSAFKSDIGENNISYARKKLKNQGIPIVGECVGGSQGRSVEFSVASGIVTVKTKF